MNGNYSHYSGSFPRGPHHRRPDVRCPLHLLCRVLHLVLSWHRRLSSPRCRLLPAALLYYCNCILHYVFLIRICNRNLTLLPTYRRMLTTNRHCIVLAHVRRCIILLSRSSTTFQTVMMRLGSFRCRRHKTRLGVRPCGFRLTRSPPSSPPPLQQLVSSFFFLLLSSSVLMISQFYARRYPAGREVNLDDYPVPNGEQRFFRKSS